MVLQIHDLVSQMDGGLAFLGLLEIQQNMEDIEKVLHINLEDVRFDPIHIGPVPLLYHGEMVPNQLAKDTPTLVHHSQYICTLHTIYKNR